tara:strand:- start:205 stop:312 length:108 start_codon:yes stop_codon:yes gene_type:complete
MNKYNNKKEEETANKVLIAMIVVFCVITIINYVTM